MDTVKKTMAAANRLGASLRVMAAIGALSLMAAFSSPVTAQTAPTAPLAGTAKPQPATPKAATPKAAAKPQAQPQLPAIDMSHFDHNKTGFVLRDIHTTLRCEQCHVEGVFKNTPRDCAGCHSTGSRVGATPKPVNHVQTTLPCDTCHVSATSFLVKSFKHIGVVNNCASCHNGQSLGVVSKPANHFPTLLPCENCHTNTTTFTSGKMDHTGITSGCASCHSGQYAGVVSKPAMHIPTTSPCELCHTGFVSFLGAKYTHDATAPNNCSTCHGGTYPGVVSKPATHLATTAQCDTCHTQTNTLNYTTFLGALYTHTAADLAGPCSKCHNGVTAMGKPTWHIATTQDCGSCHTQANTSNYTTFLGATGYAHSATDAGKCATCHTGSATTGAMGKSVGHIPTGALSCDGCHQMYNGTTVTTFAGAAMNHTVTTATRCDICHNGSYTTQGLSGAQQKVSNHIPTAITGALDCNTCHLVTIATTITAMSWAQPPEKMNHNNAQGGGAPVYCVTCHLTGTTYLGSMQKKSHNGASTAKDCSSSSCHKPLGRQGTAYVTW